jgi:hypothetical protein
MGLFPERRHWTSVQLDLAPKVLHNKTTTVGRGWSLRCLVLGTRKHIIAAQVQQLEWVMSRFVRLSFVSIVATTFLSGVAMTPAFAQATKLSKADQRLLKAAIASCKSEAKTKKVKLLSRRQYVVDCVEALKDRPQVNVQEALRNHPDLKRLPCHPNPDPGYRLACGAK